MVSFLLADIVLDMDDDDDAVTLDNGRRQTRHGGRWTVNGLGRTARLACLCVGVAADGAYARRRQLSVFRQQRAAAFSVLRGAAFDSGAACLRFAVPQYSANSYITCTRSMSR